MRIDAPVGLVATYFDGELELARQAFIIGEVYRLVVGAGVDSLVHTEGNMLGTAGRQSSAGGCHSEPAGLVLDGVTHIGTTHIFCIDSECGSLSLIYYHVDLILGPSSL